MGPAQDPYGRRAELERRRCISGLDSDVGIGGKVMVLHSMPCQDRYGVGSLVGVLDKTIEWGATMYLRRRDYVEQEGSCRHGRPQ